MNTASQTLPTLSRRAALSIGGAGLLGLTHEQCVRADSVRADSVSRRVARAKSVIFLFQFGGPSHLDTLDYKPDAPREIRGQFDPIETTIPGHLIGAHTPRLAQVLAKTTLVHTLHHGMKNHNPASYYALTGHAPLVDDIRMPPADDLFPAYGSIVDRFAREDSGIPTFVGLPHIIRDGSVTPGQRGHFLGGGHDPLVVTGDPSAADFHPPELVLPQEVSPSRLQSRRAMLRWFDTQSRMLDSSPARSVDALYDRACDLISSTRVREAFDLSQEAPTLREAYGRSSYGQSCLLARRLVEAGVKFVNVYFSNNIGGQSLSSGGWDTHGFNQTFMYPILKQWQLPLTDLAVPTLIDDLDSRGLLDETLVVWMGEFGRTPKLNGQASRDHWPHCYTALLAGGGVKRGYRHGRSDHQGAYPADKPVRLDDLSATVFSLLGLDPHAIVPDKLNRPVPIAAGDVVSEIIS